MPKKKLEMAATLTLGAEVKEKCRLLFAELEEKKVTVLKVPFSGSGDEGFVDASEFEAEGKSEDGKAVIDTEAVRELTYEVLDAHGGDFANNEGGYGNVVYRVKDREVFVEFYYNVVTPEASHQVTRV